MSSHRGERGCGDIVLLAISIMAPARGSSLHAYMLSVACFAILTCYGVFRGPDWEAADGLTAQRLLHSMA